MIIKDVGVNEYKPYVIKGSTYASEICGKCNLTISSATIVSQESIQLTGIVLNDDLEVRAVKHSKFIILHAK